MEWYQQPYIHRRDWILQHIEELGLTSSQVIVCMMIDYLAQQRLPIGLESLAKRCNLSVNEVDDAINVLCAKGYLQVKMQQSDILFFLDGLFEYEQLQTVSSLDTSLFEMFETEFGRPLTQREMEKISDWVHHLDTRLIIYALREASVQQKCSIEYIGGILNNWHKNGITVEKIEARL